MAPMEEFIEMLKSHNRIVFFGGAGVSTESDIPDFRGKGGLYRQKTELPWSPEEMLSGGIGKDGEIIRRGDAEY